MTLRCQLRLWVTTRCVWGFTGRPALVGRLTAGEAVHVGVADAGPSVPSVPKSALQKHLEEEGEGQSQGRRGGPWAAGGSGG